MKLKAVDIKSNRYEKWNYSFPVNMLDIVFSSYFLPGPCRCFTVYLTRPIFQLIDDDVSCYQLSSLLIAGLHILIHLLTTDGQ